MPRTIAQALYTRLHRSERFRHRLEDLHLLSGMESSLLDSLGNERVRFPRAGWEPWRQWAEEAPVILQKRAQFRQERLMTGATPGESPWREVIYSIQWEGEQVGYVLLSAYCPAGPLSGAATRFWSELAKEGVAPTARRWEAFLAALPRWTGEQTEAWERVLSREVGAALREIEPPPVAAAARAMVPVFVRRACKTVQAEFRGPLRLHQVAARCGVSPEHLSRSFHHATGLRFREYLAETRIHAVCEELKKTDHAIAEIALRCGFRALSRFNRSFKETTGMTPREWRRREVWRAREG
jgi:AraC-like DNA-binding protein